MIIRWLINTASKCDQKCLSVVDATITPVFISDWLMRQISRQLAKNRGDRGEGGEWGEGGKVEKENVTLKDHKGRRGIKLFS